VYGLYSEYVASDLGLTGRDFSGDEWQVGGELAWNFWQDGDLFLDAVFGAFWERVHADNELVGISSADSFLRPEGGLRLERTRATDALFASAFVETNLDGIAGTSNPSASLLGRAPVNKTWWICRWESYYSFFLEPVLNRPGWEDLSTPRTSTLAHEVALSFRGQYTFNDKRPISQAQQTVGGMFTVRGYRESAAAGDNVIIASAEYRYHVPRAFAPRAEPGELFGQPFRWRPPSPRGRPDWDFIIKAFIDYGRADPNSPIPGEFTENLLGAGIGADLVIKRNLTVRVDWGVALRDASDVTAGSNRFHVAATVLY
jgi:hypothetical protein